MVGRVEQLERASSGEQAQGLGLMLLALLGASAGFMLARYYSVQQEKQPQIVILDVLPSVGIQQQAL